MTITFTCSGCGRRLKVSEVYRGKRTKCPECAAVSVVPAGDEPPPAEEGAIQEAPAESGVARVGLAPGQAEGIGVSELGRTCPGCRKVLPRDAVLCVDCGYDLRTGRRLELAQERFEKKWDSGMPLPLRIGMLIALECLCLPAGAMTGDVFWGLALVFAGSVFLVLLLGTYIKLHVVRTTKGKILVTRTWCLLFIPAIRHQVNARNYDVLVIDTSRPNVIGIIASILLVFLCVCPGLIMAYIILTRTTSHIFLRKRQKDEEFMVYQTMDDNKMREVVETLQELAGLRIDRR
jgi:hypothetical protein